MIAAAQPAQPAAAAADAIPPLTDVTALPARVRWGRALRALSRVMRDPGQTDQVLQFGVYANAGSMKRRAHRFYDAPGGRRLYQERRAIDSRSIDLDALGRLPEGTLGRAYADFMRTRGLTPEVFDGSPQGLADPELAYVVQRIRQTHDLWHVVTGISTDFASEVVLQAFTFAQVRAPSAGIIATAGTLRGLRARPRLPRDVVRAFRAGRRAGSFATFPWEDHWATPLATVRQLLGVEGPLGASEPAQPGAAS